MQAVQHVDLRPTLIAGRVNRVPVVEANVTLVAQRMILGVVGAWLFSPVEGRLSREDFFSGRSSLCAVCWRPFRAAPQYPTRAPLDAMQCDAGRGA